MPCPQPQPQSSEAPNRQPEYYSTSTLKFCVVSLLTLGLFSYYWCYKNWQAIEKTQRPGILPKLRGVFAPFFSHSLLKTIQRSATNAQVKAAIYPFVGFCIYFFTPFLTRVLNLYELVALLSFIGLIPANIALAKINAKNYPKQGVDRRFTAWNAAFATLCTPMLILTIVASTATMRNYEQALKAHEFGQNEKAAQHYQLALEQVQDSLFAWPLEINIRAAYGEHLLSQVEQKPELLWEAREQYNEALSLNELDRFQILALFDVGYLWSALAKTYQLEAAYTDNVDVYYDALQNAFYAQDKAATEFEAEQQWRSLNASYYSLGEIAEWYGDYEEAIRWLEKAVELDKRHGFEDDLIVDSQYLERLRAALAESLVNSDRGSEG
ncbi:tetratricopeptide repeat protein [Paraferrimonas haliotis]|uniref:Tetratricopeptide repeat protein n=2 Tax=Paraferrimonas haliotis TaxID=2013866 RepID=A0AA37TS29_9GAMM|nr:tetratricopeptide repeat protein [Paraferrimonas haliotis]GLS83262.1 hypothetical protein GCM10007894_12390 [Paraferrimonas haliotis]